MSSTDSSVTRAVDGGTGGMATLQTRRRRGGSMAAPTAAAQPRTAYIQCLVRDGMYVLGLTGA
ncbi:hypothetical protein GCM10023082_10870 [Streptomyces tremellae]|uniref:Uncharacterized protein n=1 Tax=Streptomyces tremellae TaxID=1124239 RepID=A0ABP7E8B4_9ACTN